MKQFVVLSCVLVAVFFCSSALSTFTHTASASGSTGRATDLVVGAPTVSTSFIAEVLQFYHSPAAPYAQALYYESAETYLLEKKKDFTNMVRKKRVLNHIEQSIS